MFEKFLLTTNRLTGPEDLGYLRIHVDHHVLLSFELVIPRVHPGLHPFGEDVARDGVDHVCYVLPGQLLELLVNRKVAGYLMMVTGERLHVLDRQAFELRHVDVLGLVALDPLLGARLDVLQVPDGHVFERWQVRVDLRGQETVYLSFALELRGELSSGYLGLLVEDLGLPSGCGNLVVVVVHLVSWRFHVDEIGI